MNIFDLIDKKTFEESLAKAESMSRGSVMNLFDSITKDIPSLTPQQWVALLTIGIFLMSDRELNEVCRTKGIIRKKKGLELG